MSVGTAQMSVPVSPAVILCGGGIMTREHVVSHSAPANHSMPAETSLGVDSPSVHILWHPIFERVQSLF